MRLIAEEERRANEAEQMLRDLLTNGQQGKVDNRPLQSNSMLRELQELNQLTTTAEHAYAQVLAQSRSKESHLRGLISEIEARIAVLRKREAERDREQRNKMQLDLLMRRLNAEKSSRTLLEGDELDDAEIAAINVDFHLARLQTEDEEARRLAEEEAARKLELERLETERLEAERLKKEKLEREKRARRTMAVSPDTTVVAAPTLQYPLTLIVTSQVHYTLYSLEQDTIQSLRLRIFQLLSKVAPHSLTELEAQSADDISLKTTSYSYFSIEPKVFLSMQNLPSPDGADLASSPNSWKSCSPSNRSMQNMFGGRESPTLTSSSGSSGHQGTCTIRLFVSTNIIKTFLFHDFINTKSRRQKKIDLLLIDRDTIEKSHLLTSYDYSEISKLHSRESLEIELEDERQSSEAYPSLSYSVTRNFRIRIGGLKHFNSETYASILTTKSKIYVAAQMYQCGYKIGAEMTSPAIPLLTNASWLHWVEGAPYNHIPSNSTLCLVVRIAGAKANPAGDDVAIGWINFRIWDYKGRINSGFHSLRLFTDGKPNPIGDFNEASAGDTPLTLSFEIEMSSPAIIFAPLPRPLDAPPSDIVRDMASVQLSFSELQGLTAVIEKDPLTDLTQDERDLCWKYRHYCKHIAKSTSKVILSVPWDNPECVQELYQLLHDWSPLEPVDTLELLSSKFLDGEVRKFAIKTLRRMNDQELTLYLPQLVQALKHEPNHYSTLAKFLLRRVLLNRQNMGQIFFWQIKSEIKVGLCKVKESKTLPLWLSFYNHDPMGDNILAIFKAGDDLRQDQLTLQMIDIMDRMWLAEGIDLQTISYKCIATGPFEGMIEIVGESMTIAEIQKLSGGVTAAFSETAIASWLKQMNPSEHEYNVAVENFVRSCAGCCVYTFILGIGDRHNDNIDFGRFLGNVQTWNGIKRERSPFVFPTSFKTIIGEHFKTFEEICGKAFNIIRKKAHVFLNLFLMMVSTGMPELNHRDDIKYLRDALLLDLTNEQAAARFSEMIQESLKAKATAVNFAVHILANPN
eukprot:gene15858-18844_t